MTTENEKLTKGKQISKSIDKKSSERNIIGDGVNQSEVVQGINAINSIEVPKTIFEDKKSRDKSQTKKSGSKSQQKNLPIITPIKEPKKEVMFQKVCSAVEKEISLEKKVIKKLRKNSQKNAAELSKHVDILRRLMAFLEKIFFEPIKIIRNLWIHISQKRSIIEIL